MAPTTRSSATSTPSRPRVSTGSSGLVTPPSSSRRAPHCTKCHRPRAGHPRSGCPYVDASNPPSPSDRSFSRVAQVASTDDADISQSLSSLKIVSPTEEVHVSRGGKHLRRRLSVRFALVPEQTLASLSPTDAELVEQLFEPGMLNNDVSPQDKVAQVLQWCKTLGGAEPPKDEERDDVKIEPEPETQPDSSSLPSNAAPLLSRRMPCTLYTPTPTASLTPTELLSDQGIGGSAINMNETIYLLPDYEVNRENRISRSMSFEERSSFLHHLSRSSDSAPATLLSFSLADIDGVRMDAEKNGYIVRVLPGQEGDRQWVILGKEEDAINLLAEKFRSEEKKSQRVEGRSGGKLRAVAGGVVFGAVATWTGLALS